MEGVILTYDANLADKFAKTNLVLTLIISVLLIIPTAIIIAVGIKTVHSYIAVNKV